MLNDIITVTVLGFVAGFIFSIPILGPIGIIITTNALKGKLRFCQRTAMGASILEFFYVLIAVYGISSLYEYYKPVIPYLILLGSVVLFFVGWKITKTKLNIKNLTDETILKDKLRNKGGFRTGLAINLTNPTLFLGWLSSTFIVMSFASSIGLSTGGLTLQVNENIHSIQEMTGENFKELDNFYYDEEENTDPDSLVIEEKSTILYSVIYASMVCIGAFTWLYSYARFLVKNREKLNIKVLEIIIIVLGWALIALALYLLIKGITMI